MTRFNNVLLYLPQGIDPNEAIDTAIRLVKENGARLTIMDVVADVGARLAVLGKGAGRKKIQGALIEHRKEELESLTSGTVPGHVDSVIRVVAGTAFVEIIREVLKHRQQMVIKPVEEEDGGRLRLFGGDALPLLRKCPCPVWMVKSGMCTEIGLVLAAVDPVGAVNRKLDAKVLDLAADIAIREGAKLQVVHAWSFPYENALRSRNVMSDKEIADMRVQIERGHHEALKKILDRRALHGVSLKTHVLEGHPSRLILQVAAREGADLIVMGTVGRTGVSGLLIGNTAERVLHDVRCSVVAVKPDGFETPVH